MEVEEIFRVISRTAAEEFLAMATPEWVTERQAKKTYGTNLRKWVESGLVVPVEQNANGKRVYEGHRLKALHVYFMCGKEVYECLRVLYGNSPDAISAKVLCQGKGKRDR